MCNGLVKRAKWSLLHFVLMMLLFLQLSALALPRSQNVPDAKVNLTNGQGAAGGGIPFDLSKKNVLLLHAYTYETASSLIMDPAFVKGFADAGLGAFNLHFEFMDLAKHPDPAHRSEFAKYVGRKFEKLPIDLIIALHSPALSFLVEEGKSLFPGVPVINLIAASEFLHNEDSRSAYESQVRPLKRPFVILPYSTNVEFTVESIIRLRPDTRTLVVIGGNGLLDRMMQQAVRRGLQAWQGRLAIKYFEALPLEEVLKRVATLAPETAVLFTNFSADPDGRTYSPPEAVRRISRVANAPVFGLFDTLLGNGGIVGGVMLTHRGEAMRAVELAVEILRGRLPTEPVTILPTHFTPMFDWEQLKRWGMNENKLPSGSNVLNRPKTIWSEYKGFVIGGIAVLLAQTLLVIGLLVQRHRKIVAKESLRQKTEELDQFFNVTLDLLAIANTEGYFLGLNPAVERVLGYTREELMARPFFHFVHPDDVDRTREAVSALGSQQKIFSFENRYRCKDGTYRWLEWSSTPVGKLIYAAARDVTERKRAEQEAFDARRQMLQMDRLSRMGELSASLSHELNQPLTAILSNAGAALRFLAADRLDPGELVEILQDIVRDDKRAGDIIRSLRSLVKLEEGERELISINDVLLETIALFRSEAIIRNVKIEMDVSDTFPPLYVNKVQIQQVLINLLMNAADSMMADDSAVKIIVLQTAASGGDHVKVAVRDFGSGIGEQELHKIFEPFFTTKRSGLGMGLSLSRSIIESHGGHIWATNNPDKGITFYFDLPVMPVIKEKGQVSSVEGKKRRSSKECSLP